MEEKRKKEIDRMWMDTDVGKWAVALAQERREDAESILNKIFEIHPAPYEYLMMQEKELYKKIKKTISHEEGKEYILKLEKENSDLVDIMVAHEFSMLELYY